MSVTSAMYTGVSGLLSYGESINVIGNNIANVGTTGFKSSRTLFADLLYATYGPSAQIGRGVKIQAIDGNFSQGSFQASVNVSDVAIEGSGFFILYDGTTNYVTRAGAFRLDKNGNLVNPDGLNVKDSGGAIITLTNPVKITNIAKDGTITYLDSTGTVVTGPKIGITQIANPNGLERTGNTLFLPTVASGTITAAAANGTSDKIISNSLEMSNVDLATEFVNLIVTQRAYSANSKTITTADEMTQEVLNLKR